MILPKSQNVTGFLRVFFVEPTQWSDVINPHKSISSHSKGLETNICLCGPKHSEERRTKHLAQCYNVKLLTFLLKLFYGKRNTVSMEVRLRISQAGCTRPLASSTSSERSRV